MDPRTAYRVAAVQGASPVGLVIQLYEQMIQDLVKAVQALERNNTELRTREINHALTVLGWLQGTLDMGRGGAVARNLLRFYSNVRARLLEAQRSASRQALQEQISCLLEVRQAWTEVERDASKSSPPPLTQ